MVDSRGHVLVKRCLRGDRRALAALIDEYQRPLYNAAYRILGNSEDAADATQAAFLKAFEHLDSYDPKYKFFSWIYRIAINESINQAKRNRGHQQVDESAADNSPGPYRETEAGEFAHQVQEALMALPDHYRTVLVLRHFSDRSYRQISEILQISEKTVKSRLYSARQLMKDQLLASGVH